ncbi:MAG: efflux RND transporter periplasmic adaptor subunit [Verrucomicrobiae bacterium]|nr:efflux RND transporter periplasmic adaptor subunit [Verrucomicrobiae bacterium]
MSSAKPTLDDLRIKRRPDAKPSAGGWLIAVVVIVLLLGGAVAWWFTRSRTLEVQTVAARAAANDSGERTVLNASGYVTARREATVSSKVTGKVVEVLVEEGLRVKEGQILARLDDVNVKANLNLADAQVQSARSALAETRARLTQAELEFRRVTELLNSRIAPQADLDRAEAEAKALQARLEQQQAGVTVAERELALWQQQLEDTIIRAPFPGIVTSKNAQPGEMISPISAGGGFTRTGICTIVDMDSLEIEIDVNESYINRVQSGQAVEATLDAYPAWKIPCKVIAIIPTADRQKSTVRVRVGFDQLDPRILPEMSVKVAFREAGETGTATSPAVIVPKSAIQQQDGRDIVWVVQNGRAERRAVTVSLTVGGDTQLSAGVAAGERVVARVPAGLTGGTKLKEIKP